MNEPDPNGSLRTLGGEGGTHEMASAEEKRVADEILNSTPDQVARLAFGLVQNDAQRKVLQIMLDRNILTWPQCDLITAAYAAIVPELRLIDAMKRCDTALAAAIRRRATDPTRKLLAELLEPRPEADGSLDVMA